MNNLEETYQHPAISSTHQLDLSDFEGLATYLSQQLHLTIEMCFDRSSILYNKIIHFQDGFEKCRLIERKSSLIPELKFELVQNDFRFIIYEDFIEVTVSITIDYFHILQLHQENLLLKIEPFQTIFNQLKTLGIPTIYFCVFKEFTLLEKENYCWKNVLPATKRCSSNFELEI
jgi:hypothetical protein